MQILCQKNNHVFKFSLTYDIIVLRKIEMKGWIA